MTTLTIPQDLTVGLHGFGAFITAVQFTNTAALHPAAKLTFLAADIDNVHVSTALSVIGNAQINRIEINGAVNLSLAAFGFTGWGSADSVTVNGTLGADSLTGSVVADVINGSDGNDTIRGGMGVDIVQGGGGNDTFRYALADTVGAEIIRGGSGFDTILVDHTASPDFRSAILAGVERLTFGSTPGLLDGGVTLSGGQIGAPTLLTNVAGGSRADTLTVTGPLVDLSGVTFTGWNGRADRIEILGSVAVDHLIGSSQADHLFGDTTFTSQLDTIEGGGGDDTLEGDKANMSGGSGNDLFLFNGLLNSAGQSLDGGTGTDTLSVGRGVDTALALGDWTYDSVEVLRTEGTCDTIFMDAEDIGAAAGLFNIVDIQGDQAISIRIFGLAINLTNVQVLNFTGTDPLFWLRTTAGAATAIGSGISDIGLYETGQQSFDLAAGNDVMVIEKPVTAGSSFAGGSGTDRLSLSGIVDLRALAVAGFEAMTLGKVTGSTIATLSANQFAGITEVQGDATLNLNATFESLNLSGAAIDLSAVAFLNWGSGDVIRLTGTAAADSITGSAKADRIAGFAGADMLTGGGARDTFVWKAATDSALGQTDTVTDFVHGQDKIDLSGFASSQVFIGGAAFSGAGNEVRYDAATGQLQGDLVGGGALEWAVQFTGAPGITALDVLV